MSILVSINCITYNHENYIADALDSFLMQKTSFDYEIIVGEDCSTDRTREIIEEYVKRHPNKIKLITSDVNVGARRNGERVHENSTGKYIALCEGDDFWTDPNKLQLQVDYMENHPECTMCFHSSEIIHAPNKRTGRMTRTYTHDQISPIEDVILGGGGFCATSSLMFPKKLMDHPPEFYLSAPVGDYPMQMYLASKGHVYYIDKCMCAYRSGVVGSWTNRLSFGANVREKLIQINKGIIDLLVGFNEFTNYKYKMPINKMIEKKEMELMVLEKKAIKLFSYHFYHYSFMDKLKGHLKIFIRCYFPKLFFMLSNLLETQKMTRKV